MAWSIWGVFLEYVQKLFRVCFKYLAMDWNIFGIQIPDFSFQICKVCRGQAGRSSGRGWEGECKKAPK